MRYEEKLKAIKVVVVGATGNVGRAMLSILEERGFKASQVFAVSSDRTVGQSISFGENGETLKTIPLKDFDFSQATVALFAAGGVISREYAPRAAAKGCVVIDNSSYFRQDPDVPLVVPEINKDALTLYKKKNIIANPNCSTVQLVMALKPLHDAAGVKRVVAVTYQSTSGAGKQGMDELFLQTKATFVNEKVEPFHFSKPIAFNVIPHIDRFLEDGSTKEEQKMMLETKKILDPSIGVVATCVRVPVFIGHCVAAHVELDAPLTRAKTAQLLRKMPGVIVMDNPDEDGYMTPAQCAGDDAVFVSRIREDKTVPHGLSMWIVADNVRKGAALNAVQILDTLIRDHF